MDVSRPEGFFSTVWNLLATFWQLSPAGLAKNGGALDPSGTSTSGGDGTPSTTTTSDGTTGDGTGDNGGALDPSGGHP